MVFRTVYNHKEKLECIKLVQKQRKHVKKAIGKDPLSIVMDYLYKEGKGVYIGHYHDRDCYQPENEKDLSLYRQYKHYDNVRNGHINNKVYCSCHFSFKDEIKELGFKFDKNTKWWYIEKDNLSGTIYCKSLKERFTNYSSIGLEYYLYVHYKTKEEYDERIKEVKEECKKKVYTPIKPIEKPKPFEKKKFIPKPYDNTESLF